MAHKIYTRTGDQGQTSLVGGQRVAKTHPRLEAYGTIDELNSFIGLLLAELSSPLPTPFRAEQQSAKTSSEAEAYADTRVLEAQSQLLSVQSILFSVGSVLATDTTERDVRQGRYVTDDDVATLEHAIDAAEEGLFGWRGFILPGGTRAAAIAHVCRTVCRRAERAIYRVAELADVDPILQQYVNRLSDYFFVLAQQLNHISGQEEQLWKPRR